MKSESIIKSYIEHTIVESSQYDEDEGYFSTYRYKNNEDIWLQFMSYCLNVSYPFTEEPTEKLKHLGISAEFLQLSGWRANLYLTMDFDISDIDKVSEFVVHYFEKVFSIQISEDTFHYISYEDAPEFDEDDLLDP